MKVTIKKTGINGEGIGYIDRMPVFVPQALIGEEVEIRIVDKQKRYATAELLRVVKSSKNRIRPKCFIQNTCGACPLMIARYPAQLEYNLGFCLNLICEEDYGREEALPLKNEKFFILCSELTKRIRSRF